MADIPGNISKLNDVEISAGSPLTEALMNKIGANINALIDLSGRYQIFTSSGSFTVPENVTRVFLLGCGGGGGGAGIGIPAQLVFTGGAGGGGSVPVLVSATVTPNTVIPITIGAGGNGGYTPLAPATDYVMAQNGGATTFGSYYFSGGLAPSSALIGGYPSQSPNGGLGGAGGSYLRTSGGSSTQTSSSAGERSFYALGGVARSFVFNGSTMWCSGGGAGLEAGGDAAASSSARGGDGGIGAGGGGSFSTSPTNRGGNGGPGILIVIY